MLPYLKGLGILQGTLLKTIWNVLTSPPHPLHHHLQHCHDSSMEAWLQWLKYNQQNTTHAVHVLTFQTFNLQVLFISSFHLFKEKQKKSWFESTNCTIVLSVGWIIFIITLIRAIYLPDRRILLHYIWIKQFLQRYAPAES